MAPITILAAKENLTKTLTWDGTKWEKQAFDNAYTYSVYEMPAHNIHELSALLSELESIPNACIIRAALRPGYPTEGVVRRIHDGGDGRVPFAERAAGNPWIMIDVDGLPAPDGLHTNADRLDYIVSTLPTWFHGVTYHYQWSASAGLSGWDRLSCHLFFWLDRPITDTALIERMRWETMPDGSTGWDVDESVCRTVQPNYTAAPIFQGAPDPLQGCRSGLVQGDTDVVSLPTWTPKPKPQAQAYTPLPGGGTLGGGIAARLADIGPRYHMPIQRAIMAFVGFYGTGCDRWEIKRLIRDRVAVAPAGSSPKHIYTTDAYLDASIRGAVRKVGAYYTPEEIEEKKRKSEYYERKAALTAYFMSKKKKNNFR
ncbi:hypothetical protein SAMN05421508_106223 [Caenispirillum bisanense]|uniref:Uncharacterized protein n=2 Tax=Caenispirillum bisanense TaxID=414052 RepID=A0A286GND5_9PROT|nr:hypothetical protein SAMN05421508_106223 [Caenispirillum bisanense]